MKRTITVCVLALFLSSGISYAQNQQFTKNQEKKPSFWYGPKVGVDLLTPTIDQGEIESQIQSNYQVGIFLQIGNKFYFQPEFYYATQKEPEFINNQLTTNNVTVNTLRVPLLLGLKVIDLGVISAHIMGGPSVSFLLNESSTDPANPRSKNSYSLQVGGGIDVIGFITLDVRYSVDLNKPLDAQFQQLSWDSGVNVTLGLKLR